MYRLVFQGPGPTTATAPDEQIDESFPKENHTRTYCTIMPRQLSTETALRALRAVVDNHPVTQPPDRCVPRTSTPPYALRLSARQLALLVRERSLAAQYDDDDYDDDDDDDGNAAAAAKALVAVTALRDRRATLLAAGPEGAPRDLGVPGLAQTALGQLADHLDELFFFGLLRRRAVVRHYAGRYRDDDDGDDGAHPGGPGPGPGPLVLVRVHAEWPASGARAGRWDPHACNIELWRRRRQQHGNMAAAQEDEDEEGQEPPLRSLDELVCALAHEMVHAFLGLFADAEAARHGRWVDARGGHGTMFWHALAYVLARLADWIGDDDGEGVFDRGAAFAREQRREVEAETVGL
ncbi:hypothetical protein GGR56DRAFT_693769 [Xylariaceae sp. FL0804]|nr:hypothetical protein GGR56DRAFT_693769 [Xylariaceae sp. FL0804]